MASKTFAGMVALITGGGRGIGRQTALDFAARGARVAICSRTKSELLAVQSEIKALGGECLVIEADVSKEKDVADVVEQTLRAFGRVDCLVNNAGVVLSKPLNETTGVEFQTQLAVNVLGPFYGMKHVLNAAMLKQGSGVIVNVSSMAGKRGIPRMSAYCASKFALVAITESAAKELKDSGVKVFAVCPRGVDTQLFTEAFPGRTERPVFKPADISEKILAFADPACPLPSGTCLDIDFEKK